jgi:hypothetical protein
LEKDWSGSGVFNNGRQKQPQLEATFANQLAVARRSLTEIESSAFPESRAGSRSESPWRRELEIVNSELTRLEHAWSPQANSNTFETLNGEKQ